MKKNTSGRLLAGMVLAAAVLMGVPHVAMAQTQSEATQAGHTVSGTVTDGEGEPLTGAIVRVKGAEGKLASCDIDGRYTLKGVQKNDVLLVTFVGMNPQEVAVGGRTVVNVVMKEESNTMTEVVVTAMGILRKEKSLTYATQQVKADDFMKVQDANVANSLEGRVAGITITPSAGGAGGASKILLRGNKSILGDSSPLIVVDGVPMTNGTRGQITSAENMTYQGMTEGGDPLSMINPDDIESINVLKGANAAALYGSRAANGVLMITTKKGRQGKLEVTYTGNVTFDTPLMTPKIQGTYGAAVNPLTKTIDGNGWGGKVVDSPAGIFTVAADTKYFRAGATNDVHLRNSNHDDVGDFFRTGVTTNNSVSLSGGTDLIRTYFSAANSHANGMLQSNNYNRNSAALRQTYNLFKNRLTIDASINYIQTRTKNRTGGGTVMNPIYHLYMTPRNIDMGYYRHNYAVQNGEWHSDPKGQVYQPNGTGGYDYVVKQIDLAGPRQEWAYLQSDYNNPYWLLKQNSGVDKDERIFGGATATLQIWDGLSFQARYNFDNTRYDSESKRYATTFIPSSMEYVGRYWKTLNKSREVYTDYLLSYNKTFKEDWSVSATAGWVGHTIKYENQTTAPQATYVYGLKNNISDRVNLFMTNAGDAGVTSTSYTTNWDKAALVTAQFGWKEAIYLDGSYRRDWYRAFRQFRDRGTPSNFGYFGFGASAIISELVKMPEWISYFKYRLSYSEVGNSIPNQVYTRGTYDLNTGAISPTTWSSFKNPRPEKTSSLETGLDMQFFDDRLSLDLTFYNAISDNQFMVGYNQSGKAKPVNSGKVRNRGLETTLGYNFRFGKDWRWRTSFNYSYNKNRILETVYNEDGSELLVYKDVAGVRVRYREGGSYGDMYINDFQRNEDGTLKLNSNGMPMLETAADKIYSVKIGNMNSKHQLGWSNTINYKNFQLFFLINGRVGGKVISLTEAYLDEAGLSQRTADARLAAEASGLMLDDKPAMYLPDGSGRLITVENWYKTVGARGKQYSPNYVYSATNFRLRELSLGYTFQNLLGNGKHLALSFIARNLFFFYKDAPVDPDISLSTGNGLGGFEVFNMPSSRSYGMNVKLNF